MTSGCALKPFFPAVLALVVGIVLGAWQPRGELLAMRAELDELRAQAARPCRGGAAESIRSILRADAPDLERPDRRAPAPSIEITAEAEPDEAAPEADVPTDAPVAEAPQTPEQLRDAMRTALDARRAQALAALAEQGDLDDDAVEAVEAAMNQMNRELKAEVDAFVDAAVESGSVDRRDLMDFAAESLDIVIAADDRMRSAVPEDVYAAVDESAVDPFSYVSGDTLEALVRLEGVDAPMLGQ